MTDISAVLAIDRQQYKVGLRKHMDCSSEGALGLTTFVKYHQDLEEDGIADSCYWVHVGRREETGNDDPSHPTQQEKDQSASAELDQTTPVTDNTASKHETATKQKPVTKVTSKPVLDQPASSEPSETTPVASKTASKKKSRAKQKAGTAVTSKSTVGNPLVRIGNWDSYAPTIANQAGDDIKMHIVVVAEVFGNPQPPSPAPGYAAPPSDKIVFSYVESWLVNGISIGHCDQGRIIKGAELDRMLREVEPDPFFCYGATSIDVLKRNVYDALRRAELTEITQEQLENDEYTGEPLVLPPVSPRTGPDEPPKAMSISKKTKKGVEALLCFKNHAVQGEDLGLETNLQTILDHDEKYKSFEECLLLGDDDFQGIGDLLTKEESEGGSGYWLAYDVYVLQQTPNKSLEMYCWQRHPSLPASCFIDREVTENYGKQLYIEVIMKPDPDSDALDQKRVELLAHGSKKLAKSETGKGSHS